MGEKGEITKDRILKKATALFNKKGISDTSINDLLKVTGLTKGGLYFYFSGKRELTLAVLEKAAQEFSVFLDASLSGNSPGECIENFFQNVLEKHKKTKFVGGCIFGNTALEMSDKDKLVSALIISVFDQWKSKLKKTIKEAQKAGQVRKDLPAENLSNLIISTIEGGIMLSRLTKKEAPLKDCLDSLRKLLDLKT